MHEELVNMVLGDAEFNEAPGAKRHHHNWRGGLRQHTLEVVRYCDALLSVPGCTANREVVLLAAVFHDWGKIYDYKIMDDGSVGYRGKYSPQGHMWCSESYWLECASKLGLGDRLIAGVTHCIRAHHGRTAWNAIEEPNTPEAWILHFADMMSSQCHDGTLEKGAVRGTDVVVGIGAWWWNAELGPVRGA